MNMNNEDNNFFEQLSKNGIEISPLQKKQISDKINLILNYVPRIGVFGKTGSGKSSLCNALFGKDACPVSDVKACTRNIQEVILNLDGGDRGLKLIDVPGVGESVQKDEEYAELYANLLPELDLVLWLLKADDRAYSTDEVFYKNILKPHLDDDKPFFLVLNQADKIEPHREWNEEEHKPGAQQFQNIHHKVDDVAKIFNIAASKIIPISASENYNLTKLVDEFVRALPAEKKITMFRAVTQEFHSKATSEHVKNTFMETVSEILGSVVSGAVDVVSTIVSGIIDITDKVHDFYSNAKSFFRFPW